MAGKRRRRTSTISAVSSTESVVWVTKASLAASRGWNASASAVVSTKLIAPSGSWPSAPTTSGCPAWPISAISRPAA